MSKQQSSKYDYQGFRLEAQPEIDRISPDIAPNEFFKKYVAARRPCIFTSSLPGQPRWTNSQLKKLAGKMRVKVEQRDEEKSRFGTGSLPKLTMTFGEFLDRVDKTEMLYLTTQYDEDDEENVLEEDEDGEDRDSPMRRLSDVFPTPTLGLVPEIDVKPALLVNLWMGNSKEGTSSGLHHDFHDNLYVLLRGKKRFTIMDPGNAPNLYTHGTISKIHPNGLITYEGHPSREDGASGPDLVRYIVRKTQDDLEDLKGNPKASATDIAAAEQRLESALESMLDEDIDGEDDDEFDEEMRDDYVDSGENNDDANGEAEDDEEEEDEEGEAPAFPDEGDDDNDDDDAEGMLLVEEDDDSDSTEGDRKRKRQNGGSGSKSKKPKPAGAEPFQPPSFCKVEPYLLHQKNTPKEFPLLAKATKTSFELKEGEMLYLPASWFHEVASYGSHVALNYWMHPPSANNFQQPYPDAYWTEKWEKIAAKMESSMGRSQGK